MRLHRITVKCIRMGCAKFTIKHTVANSKMEMCTWERKRLAFAISDWENVISILDLRMKFMFTNKLNMSILKLGYSILCSSFSLLCCFIFCVCYFEWFCKIGRTTGPKYADLVDKWFCCTYICLLFLRRDQICISNTKLNKYFAIRYNFNGQQQQPFRCH